MHMIHIIHIHGRIRIIYIICIINMPHVYGDGRIREQEMRVPRGAVRRPRGARGVCVFLFLSLPMRLDLFFFVPFIFFASLSSLIR